MSQFLILFHDIFLLIANYTNAKEKSDKIKS